MSVAMKDREGKGYFSKVATAVLLLLCIGFAALLFAVLLYIEILVAVIYAIVVVAVGAFILTRIPRKRLGAERQIRRLCKKEKYRFKRNRNLFHSFFWDSKKYDLVLTTGRYVYYVHYLTPKKYNGSLTFEDRETVVYATKPLDNKFTVIFNVKSEKTVYKTDFEPMPEIDGKKCVRVILVNPVCREMYEKSKEGGYVATGNGMSKFGYTVMTGTGFVETVQRNEQN